MRILGVDPGFANLGFCVIELSGYRKELLLTKLVVTEKSKKKAGKLRDEERRLVDIEQILIEILDSYRPAILVIEEPGKCLMRRGKAWVTNGATLRTSCLAWGAIHGICRSRKMHCVSVGSQKIKLALCGSKSASKFEVQAAVKAKFPKYAGWPSSKKIEHVADAVGAAITGLQDQSVVELLDSRSHD
mgnify:CR=1 FL=1